MAKEYLVCEYCFFATKQKREFDRHLRTDKHARNTGRRYIEIDDPNEIIRQSIAKKEKKKFCEEENKTIVLDI